MGVPASDTRFLRKLYLILVKEDPAIVRWDAEGTSFSIFDTAVFQKLIKSKYHLSSLCTFRQNLQAHGFTEIEHRTSTAAAAAGPEEKEIGEEEEEGGDGIGGAGEDGTSTVAAPVPETYYHEYFVKGHPEYLEKIPFDPSMKFRCQECKRQPNEAGTKCSMRRETLSAPSAGRGVGTVTESASRMQTPAPLVQESSAARTGARAPLMIRIDANGGSLKASGTTVSRDAPLRSTPRHNFESQEAGSDRFRLAVPSQASPNGVAAAGTATSSSNVGSKSRETLGGSLNMSDILANISGSSAQKDGADDRPRCRTRRVGCSSSPGSPAHATARESGTSGAKDTSFLGKLFSILENEDASIVSWSGDGKSFTVHDTALFEQMLKTKYQLANMCTFRHYLRAHGFKEVVEIHHDGDQTDKKNSETYCHDQFTATEPRNMYNIVYNGDEKPFLCQGCTQGSHCSARQSGASRAAQAERSLPTQARSPFTANPLGAPTSAHSRQAPVQQQSVVNSDRHEADAVSAREVVPEPQTFANVVRHAVTAHVNQKSNAAPAPFYPRPHSSFPVQDRHGGILDGYPSESTDMSDEYAGRPMRQPYDLARLFRPQYGRQVPDPMSATASASPGAATGFAREQHRLPASTPAAQLSTRLATKTTAGLTVMPSFQAPMSVTLSIGGRKRAKQIVNGFGLEQQTDQKRMRVEQSQARAMDRVPVTPTMSERVEDDERSLPPSARSFSESVHAAPQMNKGASFPDVDYVSQSSFFYDKRPRGIPLLLGRRSHETGRLPSGMHFNGCAR